LEELSEVVGPQLASLILKELNKEYEE
jgi:hypothetical protein